MNAFPQQALQFNTLTVDGVSARYYQHPNAFQAFAAEIGLVHGNNAKMCQQCYQGHLAVVAHATALDGFRLRCTHCGVTKSLRTHRWNCL